MLAIEEDAWYYDEVDGAGDFNSAYDKLAVLLDWYYWFIILLEGVEGSYACELLLVLLLKGYYCCC